MEDIRKWIDVHCFDNETLRGIAQACEDELARRKGEEVWGTLEGAEKYLEHQRNIAFLALYRLNDEPFMPKRMRADLEEQAIGRCNDSGMALDVIRECVKLAQEPQPA